MRSRAGYLYLIMYNVIKRTFNISVVVATIMWSVGVAALVPSVAQGAVCPTLAAGDMVKVTGKAAIYAIRSDLKVLYFPSGDEFKSWRPTYGGYVSITQECFDSLSVPGNYPAAVNFHPGSYLIKRPSSDQLYVVEPNNTRATITSELATTLYGTSAYADGVGAKVMTVSDVFWPHYINVGTPITEAKAHPGMLVKVDGKTYYVDSDSKLREVSTTGFTANGFQEKFVRTLPSTAIAGLTAGAMLEAEEAAIVDKTQSGGVTTDIPSTGNVSVALASNTPGAQDIPVNSSVEFVKYVITNTGSTDVSITGITLTAYGLGNASEIDGVTIYQNGVRYGNAKDIDSNKEASINFTSPIVIAKGASVTIDVKAKVTGTGRYALGIAEAADMMGVTAAGNFPVTGNTMAGINVVVGQLTVDDDGSLSSIKLGDKQATVGKFKLTNNNVEDITFKAISLKRDSASTANDSALENLKLYMDGMEVASASSIVNKYVNFTLTSPVSIIKNAVKRFTVKADAVDGAGKNIILTLDATSDLTATGDHYGYGAIVVDSHAGSAVTINAGAVTIEKINATNTKLLKDQTDQEFGTFKVTVNSGATVEMSTLKLTFVSVNDPTGAQIENVEVFDKYNNTVYDLTSSSPYYQNTSMGLVLASGVTHELVVRADVKSTATNGDYTVSIANAGGGDMVLKETGDDTTITDITPNSVSLNKVQVEGATVTFSKNALSAAYEAVVGSTNHDLLSFNIKAGQAGQIKVTQLKFKDRDADTITKSIVSEFKLYKGTNLVKTVSANDLSSEEITFTDLAEYVDANATNAYVLKTSLVNDSNNNGTTTQWYLSGYSAEETNKGTAIYDTVADGDSDGSVEAAETGYTSLLSARVLTIRGYGMLDVSVDNTVTLTKYDMYAQAGTNDVAVGTFKFRATNEQVKVTSLKVVASGSVSTTISKFALYEEGGSTPVAYVTTIGDTTSTLDQDFIVPSSEKYYTLKADFTKIGQNEPGALNVTTTFRLAYVEAEGVSSGATLAAGNGGGCQAQEICYEGDTLVNYSNVSKEAGVVASKVNPVALVNSYSGHTVGGTKISSGVAADSAIIAVTVPTTVNNNADGTSLKTYLTRVKLNIEHNVTSYLATLERIGGSAAATSTVATSSANYFMFANLTGADYQVTPGETAYFLVKVTPTFTATYSGEKSIKVNLDKLDGTAVTNDANGTNFSWLDRADATAKTSVRLPGISSITGTQLSN